MSGTAISVEGLSKAYLIGHQAHRERYTALRDVIGRGLLGYARRAGDLFHGRQVVEGDEVEEFWALKDLTFDVQRGEVLGIIGRNGAGKSTLLKILSRITQPTHGVARLRGRVSSLLEVGTGFHPELTGRENIFLNGAILGMTRKEIQKHFDEIVDFAGVEKFLDTPIKRFSSGMYVRLAFAVAAYLRTDILFVDEVLAVGDAQFQKKCLGKMDELARDGGRALLFVSHNLAAMKSLATRAIVLDRGQLAAEGAIDEAISAYLDLQEKDEARVSAVPLTDRGEHSRIAEVTIMGAKGPVRTYTPGTPLQLEILVEVDGNTGLSLEILLCDAMRMTIGLWSLHHFEGRTFPSEPGRYRVKLDLQPVWLASGRYYLDVRTSVAGVQWDHIVSEAAVFDVPFSNVGGHAWDFKHSFGYGSIALPLSRPASLEKF